MGALTLRQVRKRFGNQEVIRGIDLQVHEGEFLVFVGPSGCGKSTTLRMIAGLESISSGELCIDGTPSNEVHPARRGAAMVFQNYALYPHMTVAENMGFALRMAGVPRTEREARVRKAAQALRIEELLDRLPRELSGGQRQRVAIGRAIVRQPKVFLFDEPLSNLDAALRVDMRVELRRLHARLGTTMVYVTHDQVEAMTLGDRIAVFNRGRIEQVGSPLELYERPCNTFVATFLGAPRMNLVSRPQATSAMPALELWRSMVGPQGEHDARIACAGVRPENLQVRQEGPGVQACIELAEHLGDSTLLHLHVEGLEGLLVARAAAHCTAWSRGQRVAIQMETAATHRFDAEGLRLE